MIVRINTGAKPGGAVRYNEEKVAQGEAKVIGINNYPDANPESISLANKIGTLDDYILMNERIAKPTLHLSLAFHPEEKLTDELLRQIGEEYLEGMGYGAQPALLYRHEDTAHPHIHIVTVSVDDEGKRISQFNDRYRSDAIRKELELKYKLVQAEQQGKEQLYTLLKPEDISQFTGQQTKKAIGNVVLTGMKDYHFSNIDTFDRFLQHHNVQLNQVTGKKADGSPYRGLSFQLAGKEGPTTPAIKASQYSFSPTIDNLEKRFRASTKKQQFSATQLFHKVTTPLKKFAKLSEDDFKNELRKNGIQVLDNGKDYVYIDHKSRSVLAEKELPKNLSRAVLTSRFVSQSELKPEVAQPAQKNPYLITLSKPELSEKERLALSKDVSKLYQNFRRESGIYYESLLIEKFPFEPLSAQLIANGIPESQARTAVRLFENYKQSQLPELKSKEDSYFQQTTAAYVNLAKQMPISSASRQQFLSAVGLELVPLKVNTQTEEKQATKNLKTGFSGTETIRLQSVHNPAYGLNLNRADYQQLLAGTTQEIPFGKTLSKDERSVYLAAGEGLARQQIAALPVSFANLNFSRLKKSLPPTLVGPVSAALNQCYLGEAVLKIDPSDNPKKSATNLLDQLYRRGLVVVADGTGFKAGYSATMPASFVRLADTQAALIHQQGGLPTGYAEEIAKLETPLGRQLVQLQQGIDAGSATRIEWLLKTIDPLLSRSPTGENLPPPLIAESLRQQLQQMAVPPLRQLKVALTPAEEKQAKLIQSLIWGEYFKFRGERGFLYESSLLRQPAEFPQTRLVRMLTESTHQIPPLQAASQVDAFKAARMGRFETILTEDQSKFLKASTGYLNMVSQAPLTAADKQGVLKALYLDMVIESTGQTRLRDRYEKNFSLGVDADKHPDLLTSAPRIERISVPKDEFPRNERQLYEIVAMGGKLANNPTDTKPLTFLNMNVERVKTILPVANFHRVSQWLNSETNKLLLASAPVRLDEKLRSFYQLGFLVKPTAAGRFTMGHHLTDPATYTPLPPELNKLLLTKAWPDTSQIQQANLTTERGRMMVQLASALQQNNPKRVDTLMQTIMTKALSFGPLASNPPAMLDALSNKGGALRDYQPASEKPWSYAAPTPLENVLDPLRQSGGGPSLMDVIADASDTSREGKKTRIGPAPKRRGIKR